MTPFLMPIGIVEEATETGGLFLLTGRRAVESLTPGTPVIIWNATDLTADGGGAIAKFRGEVTEVAETTGGFIVLDQEITGDWPPETNPRGSGNPLYLGKPGSFEPDYAGSRKATPRELHMLQLLAEEQMDSTGLPISVGYPSQQLDY